jgi:hypothetical protein
MAQNNVLFSVSNNQDMDVFLTIWLRYHYTTRLAEKTNRPRSVRSGCQECGRMMTLLGMFLTLEKGNMYPDE